jgi:hypothetical protein
MNASMYCAARRDIDDVGKCVEEWEGVVRRFVSSKVRRFEGAGNIVHG